MNKYVSGNIFDSEVEALVNPVNCVGVMGKGLALEFKKRYPSCYKEYVVACKNSEIYPGKCFLSGTYLTHDPSLPKYIINFPTKNHWRDKSELDDIKSGLESLNELIYEFDIKSLAMPALGCGLGGLRWKAVREVIENSFVSLDSDIDVYIYKPL